jgi:hypothetical protein
VNPACSYLQSRSFIVSQLPAFSLHDYTGITHTYPPASPLQPPDAAIPPEEDVVSFHAAAIMRARFAHDGSEEARGVAVLFDAIVGLLSGDERRH